MTEFERGRIAGINEAVARLALWERASVGEEITFAEHAAKMVASLLPPVAPAGDREAVALEEAAIKARDVLRSIVSGSAQEFTNLYLANQAARMLSEALDALSRARTGSEAQNG